MLRAKTDFLLPFFHPEAPKLISTLILLTLLLDQKCFSSCLIYVSVYTQPTKIWREEGTEQIKILALVLPELVFYLVLPKSSKKFKTGDCIKSMDDLVNFLHCAY